MRQLTLDDADRADREVRITRLRTSLARWRAQSLDAVLPEIYASYAATLSHLEAGGAYTVTTFDPAQAIKNGERAAFRPVGAALASISRATATGQRRYIDVEPLPRVD